MVVVACASPILGNPEDAIVTSSTNRRSSVSGFGVPVRGRACHTYSEAMSPLVKDSGRFAIPRVVSRGRLDATMSANPFTVRMLTDTTSLP